MHLSIAIIYCVRRLVVPKYIYYSVSMWQVDGLNKWMLSCRFQGIVSSQTVVVCAHQKGPNLSVCVLRDVYLTKSSISMVHSQHGIIS